MPSPRTPEAWVLLPPLPCSGQQPREGGGGGGVDQSRGPERLTGSWVWGSAAFLTAPPSPRELMKGFSRFHPLWGPCRSCHLRVWVEQLGRGDAPARCPLPLSPKSPEAGKETTSLSFSPAFVDLPELMQHLDNNFKYWKGLDEMKLRSLRPPPE